jgi:hypothetical protein
MKANLTACLTPQFRVSSDDSNQVEARLQDLVSQAEERYKD